MNIYDLLTNFTSLLTKDLYDNAFYGNSLNIIVLPYWC